MSTGAAAFPNHADSPAGQAGRADARALQAAFDWQVTLWSGEVTRAQRLAFEQWLAEDPRHAQAWQRVQRVGAQLGVVPAPLAGTVLRSASKAARSSRRQFLGGLAAFAGSGLLAYAASDTLSWKTAFADYHTARGERRDLTLPDNTRLALNSATSVDLRYSAQARRVALHAGEVLVTTAQEAGLPAYRPFIVETREGSIRALGTRFIVRRLGEGSPGEVLVQVFEGAVEIMPRDSTTPLRLEAGTQAYFSASGATAPAVVDPLAEAWSRGLLVVEQRRLADFLAELARHRAGILRCDPAVADLLVSGVFPLDDTDAALHSLTRVLPVSVRTATRYWATVGPR
ncbi:MAG: FecR domain-containing protein [Moraxellaceae bacterium]|nr:FecR domain-containing protein [Moraxellaceae bacterium]